MNYDRVFPQKNSQSYRTVGTYYGQSKCVEMPGLNTLAVNANAVVEGFDYGNCNVVVPTEASMNYGKIFSRPVDNVTYKGYANVPSGYYAGQAECGSYRVRKCQ